MHLKRLGLEDESVAAYVQGIIDDDDSSVDEKAEALIGFLSDRGRRGV